MRRIASPFASPFAAFLLLAVPARAEPRAAHPQPTPSALSLSVEAGAPEDPVRAAAKAQQDAFDKRIATRSERAMRSICQGCDRGPARARAPGPRRAEAQAGPSGPSGEPGDDFVIDEPAEASGN